MNERAKSGSVTTVKVLYATDGGPAAAAAADLLMRCARREALEVTVTSAADLDHVDSGVGDAGPATSITAARHRARELALRDCRKLQSAGFHATCTEVEGQARTGIMKLAEDGDHEVILVGAGNKTRMDRLLHGSVSTHLLHHAPVPVLLVHRSTSLPKVRILVTDDGSESARRSRSVLMRLVDPAVCQIRVIGVVTPLALATVPALTAFSTETAIPTDPVEVVEFEHRRIAATRDRVAEAARAFEEQGFTVTTDIEIGHPAQAILALAEAGDYDLVVMGSRGRRALRADLLGSVSDEVSRHAAAALVAR